MLTQYQQQTQLLLDDPSAQQYSVSNLTSWINIARGQLAASTQCIRYTGDVTVVQGVQSYALAGLSALPTGVQNTIAVRSLSLAVGASGFVLLEFRPWEWAWNYWLSNPNPMPRAPRGWAIQEPGPNGSITLRDPPDMDYTLAADSVGLPVALTTDSTPEAIEYPFTDAVPYFAAYLAYLNSQREQDAQQMLAKWAQFASWGTRQIISSVLADYYPGGRGTMMAAEHTLNIGIGGPQAPAGRQAA